MLEDPFGTNPLTRAIIGCAIRVHDWIGPGVFENVYCECLDYELRDQGLHVELQRPVPIVYRGVPLKSRYYVDMIHEPIRLAPGSCIHSIRSRASRGDAHRTAFS